MPPKIISIALSKTFLKLKTNQFASESENELTLLTLVSSYDFLHVFLGLCHGNLIAASSSVFGRHVKRKNKARINWC